MTTFTGIEFIRRLKRPLLVKPFMKVPSFSLANSFGAHAAAQIHAVECHSFQGKIARFCSIDGGEQVECLFGDVCPPLEPCFCNHCRRVTGFDLFREPGRLIFLAVSDIVIDGVQTWSGQHPFVTHVQVITAQVAQQFDFVVVVRCEVCVAAFRRHSLIARAVPEEDAFAQSRSCCEQRNRLVVRWWIACVENMNFVRSEEQNPVGHSFKIVEQLHFRYVEALRQRGPIDHPGGG